jgi:hypothetical protein
MRKIARASSVLALVLALALLASPAAAADVDGTWTGSMATPNGDFPITFVFKADGSMLTGHMVGMDGTEIPIDNGTVDGDMISYSITLDFGGMPFEMLYKGLVSAAEIMLSGSVFDMPFELTVTKTE